MEESAPKRRRVSPRLSVNDAIAGTPPLSSPTRRQRPSFASPTRASLARHNPEILDRRNAGSPAKSPRRPVVARRLSNAGSDASLDELLSTEPTVPVINAPTTEEDNEPRRLSQEGSSSQRTARRASGRMSAPPRRSPMKRPNPRPLPRPESENDEDDLNPFLGRTLRRSPPVGSRLPVEPEAEPEPAPEPELPPSVPDPVSSTPPKGIHRSPSQWKYRSPDDAPVSQFSAKLPAKPTVAKPSFRDPVRRPRMSQASQTTEVIIRKPLPFDPDLEKKRKRDALLDEIKELKKDLETIQQANDRLRVAAQSGRMLPASNQNEVFGILRRDDGDSTSPPPPSATQQLMKSVLNPGALLPFGKPLPRAPRLSEMEKLPEIKSHHPILMTAAEELPYLELFSPFEIESTISRLQPLPEQPHRQLHAITLRSRDVPGLFTAKIDMVVDPMDQAIQDLQVPTLEPSAKSELQPFVEKICSGECNRCMQRNVGIMTWAMGEWLRLATERAVFWSRLDEWCKSHATPEALSQLRARKQKRKKHSEDSEEAVAEKKGPVSKKDLIHYLGQQSYEISADPDSPGPKVRLDWKIEFDWTGEAQSNLGVVLQGPAQWVKVDERGALGKIPKLFKELVGGGVKLDSAVQTILALVVGEDV